jgi:hypothetical protein
VLKKFRPKPRQDRNRNNKAIGECSEALIIAKLVEAGYGILIPLDHVNTTSAMLRLVPTKNNQEKNVRWAKDYEL